MTETVGRIAAIETHHLKIPSEYGGPPPRRDRQFPFIQVLLVRVETDTGLVGWGEGFGHNACATTRVALDTLVAPLCLGESAEVGGDLADKLSRALLPYGLHGIVAFAISAIDIALWDIRGGAAGLPVHRLLEPTSGAGRVPTYASLLRYGDPDLVAEACLDAVARGHPQVKLHEAAPETVRAARAALGHDVALMLDVNCRWSAGEAVTHTEALADCDLAWIEEPCPAQAHDAYRAMTARGATLAAGENATSPDDLDRLARSGDVAILQPSAAKHGGLSALLAAQAMARRRGVRLASHSAYFGPALAATAHFCAATDATCEWYDCRLEADPAGLRPKDGHFELADTPGLGLRIDADALRDYRHP